MWLVAWRRCRARAVRTTIGRAIGRCWMAATPALFLILPLQSIMVPENGPVPLAHDLIGFCLILGMPNLASGLILRLHSQIVVAILWWLGAVAFSQCHTMANPVTVASVLIALCEIAFGLHLMRREAPHG